MIGFFEVIKVPAQSLACFGRLQPGLATESKPGFSGRTAWKYEKQSSSQRKCREHLSNLPSHCVVAMRHIKESPSASQAMRKTTWNVMRYYTNELSNLCTVSPSHK